MDKLINMVDRDKMPIFVCIGTMKVNFDSVGPRLGTLLKDEGYIVFGTETEQIHALNYEASIRKIVSMYDSSLYQIIPVDATAHVKALNRLKDYTVYQEACKPGSGSGKNLSRLGTVFIGINVADEYDDYDWTRTCETDYNIPSKQLLEKVNNLFIDIKTNYNKIWGRECVINE